MLVGLLVNPIAGMGGRVGLKGTDGVVEEAVKLGAIPIAPHRACEFLEVLKSQTIRGSKIDLLVCSGQMGEDMALEADIDHHVINVKIRGATTSKDTAKCVRALYKEGVRLLVFVGGDGTARDILDVITKDKLTDLLVIGVPSGVKMYSGIFVVSPPDAAEVVSLVNDGGTSITEFEIMDADEEAIRQDRFTIKLYGYMRGPSVPARFQGAKQASPETMNEHDAQEAIAKYIVEQMIPDGTYILGPGTTVKSIAELLDIKKTTLGVDVYCNGQVFNDVSESKIIELIEDFDKTWIIVSPIGHQGMLFGRGNQQISAGVIERVGRDHIIVISTPAKLRGIEGGTFKVDTGDSTVDGILRGYIRVITDYNEIQLVKVE